jgi:single-stranded-DNA-specific exonuclease
MKNIEWVTNNTFNEDIVKLFINELRLPSVLAKILVQRGFTDVNQVRKFFHPDLQHLYDPFLLEGMDEAAKLIISEITNNHKILVYGDYDVDGICAAAILKLFFRKLNAFVDIYIPNRLEEGYGVSKNGIDYALQNNFSLIITVDCGITAIEEVDYARSKGLKVIISDHHQPKDILPNADVLINPVLPYSKYPFKSLSGAGVAFKLIQAIAKKLGMTNDITEYLDLVAIATAADIVPLNNENRVLVHYGLENIRNNPRPGVKAILNKASINYEEISVTNIVFAVAPRINAVGRLGNALPSIDILTSNDEDYVVTLAEELNQGNLQRRQLDKQIMEEAVKIIEENELNKNNYIFVLHNDKWHQGVNGIVASRLVEKYYKPAIMLSTVDGLAKGSARSIPGINLFELFKSCEDLLTEFGGHAAAAGVSLKIENIPLLNERLNEILASTVSEDVFVKKINIDSIIQFKDITPKFLKYLDMFAPFGPSNMRPVFLCENVKFTKIRSNPNNHFIAYCTQENCKTTFEATGYSLADKLTIDNLDATYDIVFSIGYVTKDTVVTPQLNIKDIRLHK